MKTFNKICFVCKKSIANGSYQLNLEVNLPVCNSCKGTEKEKETVEEIKQDGKVFLKFLVKDSGRGILKKNITKIFNSTLLNRKKR